MKPATHDINKIIIDVKKYSFKIGQNEILKDISFTVFEGEYLSIIGPNGAGKTTMLKCINRILHGNSGSIRLKGETIDKYSQKELAKLVSYVPQASGHTPPFTVNEFVTMGRYPHLSPFSSISEHDKKAVHEALTLTNTEGFGERFLDTLSGGERQKVFISAALAQGAKVILLDEPTTFLDPKHHDDINNTLRRINESGVTIVSVTHDINSALLFSKRIVAIKNGVLSFFGSPKDIIKNGVLDKVYEKKFLFVSHPHTGHPVIIPTVRQ